MGKKKTYSGEFKLQMVHLLAKGTYTLPQISKEYHVTRRLLDAWIQLYQKQGETAFVSDRAIDTPQEVEHLQNTEEYAVYLEWLCDQQALEFDLL